MINFKKMGGLCTEVKTVYIYVIKRTKRAKECNRDKFLSIKQYKKKQKLKYKHKKTIHKI